MTGRYFPGLPQTSKTESFATIIKPLTIVAKTSILYICGYTGYSSVRRYDMNNVLHQFNLLSNSICFQCHEIIVESVFFLSNSTVEAALHGCSYKMCSENMQQNYRRTPMRKCDFNKVAKQFY